MLGIAKGDPTPLLIHHVVLDGARYQLAPAADLTRVKNLVSDAISAGVRFVDFDTASGHLISVLITPNTSVLFTSVPAPDPADSVDMRDHDATELDDPYVEFDTWQTA